MLAGSLPVSGGIVAPRLDFNAIIIDNDKTASRGLAMKLRSGQILVPSGGFSNDAARARNAGRRLCPKTSTPPRASSPKRDFKMAKASSESTLLGTRSGVLPAAVTGTQFGLTSSSSAPVLEAKTPRTVRGVVRKTSFVQMQYNTELQAGVLSPGRVARWGGNVVGQRVAQGAHGKDIQRPNVGASWILEGSRKETDTRPSTVQANSKSSPRTVKRVTWADRGGDELGTTTSSTILTGIVKEGTPTPTQIKSKKILDGLYKLRRVGGGESPCEAPDSPSSPGPPSAELTEEQSKAQEQEDEQQLTLMNQTLAAVDDVEAQLRLTEAMLESAHEPVAELGAGRHATTLVSGRTLSVVKRKAELCRQIEAHLACFQETDSKRQDLLSRTIAQDTDVPVGYFGIRKMISSLVHRNTDGRKMNPIDADKAPFDVFASSFGLPPDHAGLVKLKSLAVDATEWWAEETLQEAYRGGDANTLKRCINVTIGFLDIGEEGHEKLIKVKVVLGDRLAEKVLAIAQKLAAKDAQVVERSTQAQPNHARQVADEIDEEIKNAVASGAPNKHPKLEESKRIAVSFHTEERARWALKALQFAEAKKEEDAAMVEKAGAKVPAVGPASEAGDAIEKEMYACLKKGAEESNPQIQEATKIMKWLRDQDGERKRMAAREKRLAEQAAAKNA